MVEVSITNFFTTFAKEHKDQIDLQSSENLVQDLIRELTTLRKSQSISTTEYHSTKSTLILKCQRKVFKNHIEVNSQAQKKKTFSASQKVLTKFIFWLSQKDSNMFPLKFANQFLDDIYECIPLEEIRQFFSFLENDLMTLEIVSETTNNITLLKICNSLLKRLSKSTHNELRGRVHMLLASIQELGDKSGLNRKSMINSTTLHVVNRLDDSQIPQTSNLDNTTPKKEEELNKESTSQKQNSQKKSNSIKNLCKILQVILTTEFFQGSGQHVGFQQIHSCFQKTNPQKNQKSIKWNQFQNTKS